MKLSPFYKEAQEKMAPGIITQTGFLGDDKRSLIEIIQADEQEFGFLSLDWDFVAKRLNDLLIEGLKGLGEYRTIDEKWLVKVDNTRGKLPSPFKDGLFLKRAVTVKNISKNINIIFSDLSIHLLKDHHFLQGRGSLFRLEPKIIKSILEL